MRRLLCVFALLAACSPAPSSVAPSSRAVVDVGTPRALASGARRADSPPPAESGAAAPPVEPPDETARSRPPRLGIGGSTRGTIACGSKRCSAPAEVCAWNEERFDWQCQAPDAPVAIGEDPTAIVACDDGTDCPPGQTCCNRWGDHFTGTTTCVARAEVDAQCASEPCLLGGASCPNGRSCEGASTDEQGACIAPKGPATCAGRRVCPAAAPYCAITQSGPQCVAKGSAGWAAAPGNRRFECTLQRDCRAGDTCAYEFGEGEHETETYCGKWHPAYQGSLVCEVGKQEPCGSDAECRATMTCHPSQALPAWMGVWGPK